MTSRSPLLARVLVSAVVPAGVSRDGILGDLDELYTEVHSARGRLRANLWFWHEAVLATIRYSAERSSHRLRRLIPQRPRPRPPRKRANRMETLIQDIRYAVRSLSKSPGFTAVAALTISLGIGATTTIFSIANAVILKAPPGVRNGDELVTVHRVSQDGSSFHSFSYPNYVDFRDGDNGLAELAVFSMVQVSMVGTGEPEMLVGFTVSQNYFDIVGARPALGRFFLPEEDQPDANLVTVLSYDTWRRRFGADSSVVGSTINLNRRQFTVVGVAEEGFNGHATLIGTGAWIPVNTAPAVLGANLEGRGSSFLESVGRLAPEAAVSQVQEAMSLIATRLEEQYPVVNQDLGVDIRPYSAMFAPAVGPATAFAALLFGVSAVVLIIASMNVGGMLLARASSRGREMALRLAIGAGRRRLVRQLVTESVLLFLLGGGAGVVLTVVATRLLNTAQLPIPIPLLFDFSPDVRALGFSLAVALVTGMVFGLAPALNVTNPDLSTTLKEDSGNATGSRSRLRSTFVVAQVAGSALLLIGAGLFVRALGNADAIDPGFDPSGVHIATYNLGVHNYTSEEAVEFHRNMVERVTMLPHVQSVGLIDMLPLSFGNQTTVFAIEGREPVAGEGRFQTDVSAVNAGYFETLHIPLLRGRHFDATDRVDGLQVVIVNETLAQQVWPGEDAVGQHMQFGSFRDGTDVEVIGVMRDAKYRTLGEQSRNMVYLPLSQAPRTFLSVVARTRPGAIGLPRQMREAVAALDSDLPLMTNTSYDEIMGIALLPNRAAASLATGFGVVGLLLAAVGLYGILSYTVSQRTREIGIRMALGARTGTVRALVLRDGAKLAGIGLGVGFAAAIGVTRLVRGLLYGISPTDPITFAGIGMLLVGVALVASLVPAVRATRTNPVDALRYE